jgi:hypothetical protein
MQMQPICFVQQVELYEPAFGQTLKYRAKLAQPIFFKCYLNASHRLLSTPAHMSLMKALTQKTLTLRRSGPEGAGFQPASRAKRADVIIMNVIGNI